MSVVTDLSSLPHPSVIEALSFETIFGELQADFQSRYPQYSALLASDPAIKLLEVAAYREGINAFLTAAIELAEPSPSGLLMPHQATMYAGRVFACSNLPRIVHLVRDLAGCQISLTPSAATFGNEETAGWLAKYFAVGDVEAEERRKLLAYGRDLLNSDYANHRLTFQLFAQSPPFSHLLAVYNNYDFEPATELMCQSAGIKTIDGRNR